MDYYSLDNIELDEDFIEYLEKRIKTINGDDERAYWANIDDDELFGTVG